MTPGQFTIVNGLIVSPFGSTTADLHVSGGRITGIESAGSVRSGDVIEADGLWVLPGAVDAHFHCRAPAHAERGDFFTETRAAAAGGVTTVMEMPISKPSTHTRREFAKRRTVGERNAIVDFALYGAAATLDRDEVLGMAKDGAVGFKVFMTPVPKGREDEFVGLSAPTADTLFQTLGLVHETGLVCTIHAEQSELTALFEARLSQRSLVPPSEHAASRPPVVESVAIALAAAIAQAQAARIHIAHVSSLEGVTALRAAAAAGADITAETCHHYLLFNGDSAMAQFGPFAKVYPPLRNDRDRSALWEAIVDGSITMMSSDHSPLTPEEKELGWRDIRRAPAGIPGVEGLVPLLLDAVLKERLTMQRAVELLSAAPARRFGLYPRKGALEPGSDADLILYDPRVDSHISTPAWYTKARASAGIFDGRSIQGHIVSTFVRGLRVYGSDGVTASRGSGKFVPGPAAVAADMNV